MHPLGSNAPERLAAEHTAMAIRARLQAGTEHSYLRDLVLGAIDGAVTTFAVVSGVAGAGLASEIVIILGVANLVGDGSLRSSPPTAGSGSTRCSGKSWGWLWKARRRSARLFQPFSHSCSLGYCRSWRFSTT